MMSLASDGFNEARIMLKHKLIGGNQEMTRFSNPL